MTLNRETVIIIVSYFLATDGQPLRVLSSHFRLDWSNMTSRNCPLTFPKKLKVDDIDYSPMIKDRVPCQASTFTPQSLHFGQQRT